MSKPRVVRSEHRSSSHSTKETTTRPVCFLQWQILRLTSAFDWRLKITPLCPLQQKTCKMTDKASLISVRRSSDKSSVAAVWSRTTSSSIIWVSNLRSHLQLTRSAKNQWMSFHVMSTRTMTNYHRELSKFSPIKPSTQTTNRSLWIN